MLPWSVFIWLVFELFNLRIQNWYYANITANIIERWLGYAISFATVLPAIFETAEFLETIGLFNKLKDQETEGLKNNILSSRFIFALGIITLFLPIAFPQYFFPLVWVCFIFLLYPVNQWLSLRVSTDVHLNISLPCWFVVRLCLAGLICGLLWEFWNWHSVAHWVYALPYFEYLRVFQMPILGYLGFIPFTLECYLMYQFIVVNGLTYPHLDSQQNIKIHRPSNQHIVIIYLLLVIFCFCMFHLLDNFTVRSFADKIQG
jgi:hypothetical protein